MSKHTPGPWICLGPSFGDPLPRYTTEICTEWEDQDREDVIQICELPLHHHDEENEANARLIAAAPDLLEALEELLCQTRQYGHKPEIKMAEAALRKARGATE